MYKCCKDITEDKTMPYYDEISETWKVVTEWGEEEGDALYIAGEFVQGGLYYPFYCEPFDKEQNHIIHMILLL